MTVEDLTVTKIETVIRNEEIIFRLGWTGIIARIIPDCFIKYYGNNGTGNRNECFNRNFV